MGRIRGWKKYKEYKTGGHKREWATTMKKDLLQTFVEVVPYFPANGRWMVRISSERWKGVKIKHTSTEREAVKYAMKWMREHPKG